MKENIYLPRIKILITYCFFCFFFLTACSMFSYALYIAEVPEGSQTRIEQPIERTIQLKLPLEQPMFHWNFLSRKDLLYGKLTLQIKRNSTVNTITIIDNGKFCDGWEAIPFVLPENAIGEIYFGFISTNKYLTSPKDEVEIELTVTKDLEGIGRLQRGILKAGVYKSKGRFIIFDETNIGENNASLELWEQQWPLIITSEEGWLPPQKAAEYKEMQKLLYKPDSETLEKMQQAYNEGIREARKNLCINNMRVLKATVDQYALDHKAPIGTIPDPDIIWGKSNSHIKNVLFCPEGEVPYGIPEVGVFPVCPNVDKFPEHKLKESI